MVCLGKVVRQGGLGFFLTCMVIFEMFVLIQVLVKTSVYTIAGFSIILFGAFIASD